MSKFARDRKKHWRYILAEAKVQGIWIEVPKQRRRVYLKYSFKEAFEKLYNSTLFNNIVANISAPNPLFNLIQTKLHSSVATMQQQMNSSIFFGVAKEDVEAGDLVEIEDDGKLRGLNFSHFWFDEETMDGGEIIQEPLNYDKDKSNE